MSLGAIAWVLSLPVAVVLLLALAGRAGTGVARLGATVAALGLAGDAARLLEQRELARFEPVPAEVVTSERGARRYAWEFEYAYEVDGTRYLGSRLTNRPRLRSRGDTDALAARYPLGERITVHVDPEDPTRAVVDARPAWLLPGVATALHLGLGLAAISRLRPRPVPQESPA